MIIATAGHIDHGKTVLVKALTGVDTDRLPEEKKRGMSIDIGFAYQTLADGRILGFVDVPGHERFVRNMLAGVTGIDFALLVVAADDGPMPQTEEHLAILDLLGVGAGAVALTKIDRVEPARVEAAAGEVGALIAGTCLAGAEILPVSGLTGAGIAELKAHLEAAAGTVKERPSDGHFRLAIDRAFSVQGAGQVVTGAVYAGTVHAGDHLILSPEGIEVRVRGLHAQNRESPAGTTGERCAINITGPGLRNADIRRGSWLLAAPAHDPVPRFDARIRVLASETRGLRHWTPVHVHLGAVEVPGRVALLDGKVVAPGDSALAQIVLDRRIGALRGDRFVLRDQSARRTMAGGWVIDPFAPQRGRAKPERIAFLEAMARTDPAEALTALLDLAESGLDLARFERAWNLLPEDAGALAELVPMVRIGRGAVSIGFAADAWAALRADLLAALRAWHEASPDKPGPSEDALRRLLSRRISQAVMTELASELAAAKEIVQSGASLNLPGYEAKLTIKDEAMYKRVLPLLESGHTKPPVVRAIATELALDPKALDRMLVRAGRMGRVVQVAGNRFMLPGAVLELAEAAAALGSDSDGGEFGAAQFRDRSGIGRNLAIEVLEFFDKSGLTWRQGDTRRVLKTVDEVFAKLGS